ncbi:hypothetical protein M5D96_013194, partial [Drosophila gunungcola]
WAWLPLVLLIAAKMEQVGGRNYLDLARTDNRLTRLPFFGGGVGHLLRYLHPLAINPASERGAQLWKLNFNATRGSSMAEREEEEEEEAGEERQVVASPDAQFNEVVALFGSEVWNINQDGIDILIEQRNVADARKFMEKVGFSYNVMIDDIESAIDETYVEVPAVEHPLDSVRNNSLPPGSLMSWRRYHDQADIQQFLQTLLETYSENVELIQIGVTRNKRPLEVIRVSNGNPDNWAVFVDAGLQARDWLSPAALTYAISKLTHLWGRPKVKGQGQRAEKAMRRIDWYFLPLANPDGYQYSRHTDRLESGCYGVNLDRNFEYGWGGTGSTSNPCKNLYRGAESFSEPESRALRSFLSGMREYLGAYVSLGGYGQAITYPWGDADYTARRAVLALRRLNQAEYSAGTSYRQKLARPGNSADWVQDRIGPQMVFNMFLKDQGRYGYLLPPHYIVESGEEVFEFMRTIAQQHNEMITQKTHLLMLLLMGLIAACLANELPSNLTQLDVNEIPQRYDEAQLWRIYNISEAMQHRVPVGQMLEQKFGGNIWKENSKDQLKAARSFLSAHRLDPQILSHNVQAMIDEELIGGIEATSMAHGSRTKKSARSSMHWKDYHDLDTIYSFMREIRSKFPNIVRLYTIGKTEQGRDLKVLRISENPRENKKVWIDGGIHAREWISPATVTFILYQLMSNWENQPAHIRGLTWYIMPVMNPDGYEYSRTTNRLWRKNRSKSRRAQCNGVDLNRNFDIGWNGYGSSTNPCSDTYRGSSPASELETRAVAEFWRSESTIWKRI